MKNDVDPVVLPKEVKGKYKNDGGKISQDATDADLKQYAGKTIKSMTYCDGCAQSGDLIRIEFTDGTEISVYAYKYNMRIYYP
jgi:exo-beta-1,3-glucanase (GH17 family)